jgi:hypothetical protein
MLYLALVGLSGLLLFPHVSSPARLSVERRQSGLKRALKGTYVSVDPAHLGRYLAEEVCQFNARHDVDGGRFDMVLKLTEGKRLTYRHSLRSRLRRFFTGRGVGLRSWALISSTCFFGIRRIRLAASSKTLEEGRFRFV